MANVNARNDHPAWLNTVVVIFIALLPLNCKKASSHRKPFGGDLPPSASDIHEQDVDMFPDWEYYFRATMPNSDCQALLAKVSSEENLHSVTEHDWRDGKGDWGPAMPPLWWKPMWADGHQHGRTGDVNTCAMCREGVFYYWSGSH